MHRLPRAENFVPVMITGKRSPFDTATPIPQKYKRQLHRFAPASMDRAAECDVMYQSVLIERWIVRNYRLYAREDFVLEMRVEEPFFMLHFSMLACIDLALSDGSTYRLFPGQHRLIQFNKGTHYLKFSAERWHETFFIDLPLDWTKGMSSGSDVLQWLLDRNGGNETGVIPSVSHIIDDELYELIQTVRQQPHTQEPIALALAEAQILDLVLYALQQFPDSPDRLTNTPPSIIDTIKSFIANNLSQLSGVEQLAENFGYSVRSFQQLFKRHAGETIRDFIIRSKMEKAQELLRRPGNSIKDIAARLGYQHPGNFTREYKHYFKQSPRSGDKSNTFIAENDS